MSDDEAFLRAIQASPGDLTTRLVYADWLEEQGDPRSEYLRLGARLASLLTGSRDGADIRQRMVELRDRLPPGWLAALGDYRSALTEPDARRIEEAATALGRQARYVDGEGFEQQIVAAAMHPLTGAVAYVDCRSKERGPEVGLPHYLDINYHLRVRDPAGRETAAPIKTYNPYFGCRVGFLEWYGSVAVGIYEEKHRTYACRFGLDFPAAFKAIEYDWIVDGPHLGYRGWREDGVRRLSVPGLEELPPLSPDEAAAWGLLPPASP